MACSADQLTYGRTCRYPPPMSAEEATTPDLSTWRIEQGLPPIGVKLNREQSLRLLAARDAGREPIPPHVHAWAREVLGLRARTA